MNSKAKLTAFEQSLKKVVAQLDQSAMRKTGDVVFNLGADQQIRVVFGPKRKTTFSRQLAEEPPLLQVSGDPERIQAILDGKKDAKQAFLEGSISVQGDIDYLVSVLKSLGLTK